MLIAILNQSKKVSHADAVTMTAACNYQMSHHLAPAWNRLAMTVVFFDNPASMPHGAFPIIIFDAPDDPGALGYHTEDRGQIYGKVFVNPVLEAGGVVLFDPHNPQNVSVASVLSHEVCELFVDPFINSWVDGPEITEGSQYALEVGDPVESDSYVVTVGSGTTAKKVAVSNFVFPAWFDDQAAAGSHFDQMGHVHSAFTMSPGGYLVVRQGAGTESQVFGAKYQEWRKATKTSPLSRTTKRSK